jgi:hypothetical protein
MTQIPEETFSLDVFFYPTYPSSSVNMMFMHHVQVYLLLYYYQISPLLGMNRLGALVRFIYHLSFTLRYLARCDQLSHKLTLTTLHTNTSFCTTSLSSNKMATMSLLKKYAILGRLKEAMDSFGDGREDEQQARWDTDKLFPMLMT